MNHLIILLVLVIVASMQKVSFSFTSAKFKRQVCAYQYVVRANKTLVANQSVHDNHRSIISKTNLGLSVSIPRHDLFLFLPLSYQK